MLQCRRAITTPLAGCLMIVGLSASADPGGDARKTITAAYAAENRAVENKDAKSMFASYSSDYSQTTKRGERLNLEGIKQVVPKILQAATKITDKTTVQKFSVKGNKAFATVVRHTNISIVNPRTHKPMTEIDDVVSVDTWVKSGTAWKLKMSQEKSEQQTIDGKPLG